MASLTPDKFHKQLHVADAVLVYGGETEMLTKILNSIDPEGKVFRTPIYAGSSAGAHILSKYYFRRSKGGVKKGFGILPIKLLVHYKSSSVESGIDWQKAESELKAIGEDLPIYKIAEGKQEIIEQGK